MKKLFSILFLCFGGWGIYAQKVTTTIAKNYGVLDYREDVRVFNLNDSMPVTFEVIGTVKVGDRGLTTNCSWETVIETAKLEARKIGGNALKVTEHLPPSLASSCHRISAEILRIENLDSIPSVVIKKDTARLSSEYALMHVYRFSGVGAFVSYDLHLSDSIICRVANKWKKTLKIHKEGLSTIWARTEVKKKLSVNIKMGEEYYIRCSIVMGAFVGHPKLELVDNATGKSEYESIRSSKSNIRDIVTLNDGREIECVITREDNDNLYVNIFRNGKRVETQIQKVQIKYVERGE